MGETNAAQSRTLVFPASKAAARAAAGRPRGRPRLPRRSVVGLALIGALLAVEASWAAPLPQNELERQCWAQFTRSRSRPGKDPTSVDFSNLRDGYTVRSPFLVAFAVRGMGVVPAGKALAGSGHHHLLIDTPLPRNVGEKIPFSDTHKHFGKGQTQTTVTLPPGPHTLRLLFADHEHRPHFVYSREIHINVAAPRSAEPLPIDAKRYEESCAAWYQDEVSRPRPPGEWLGLANLRDGEAVTSPFVLHYGVEGYGVCAAGQTAERSGHFILQLLQGGRPLQTLDLRNGATQSTLALPNGNYQLKLRLVDSTSGRDLLPAHEQDLPVTGQERM
jgi:hypothetical protein